MPAAQVFIPLPRNVKIRSQLHDPRECPNNEAALAGGLISQFFSYDRSVPGLKTLISPSREASVFVFKWVTGRIRVPHLCSTEGCGVQGVPLRTRVLRMMSSFRMQAVMTTLNGLPALYRRSANVLSFGYIVLQ